MKLSTSPIFLPVITNKLRYNHLWGGRGRGATHFATQLALFKLVYDKEFHCGFLRATYRGIKDGLWRALNERIQTMCDAGELNINDFKFNMSELSCAYIPTGNTIISKGFRRSSKSETANMKGLDGLTFIIIDEAEEVGFEDFNKLDDTLRTVKATLQILLLFNPPSKDHFLIKGYYTLAKTKHKGWYKAIPREIPEFVSIHSNFTNNTANLNESSIKKLLSYGEPESPNYNMDFYCRDVLGLVSEGKRGRIFVNVYPIPDKFFFDLPLRTYYGLDFGFKDPNAFVAVKYHDGNLYVHEILYQTDMTKNELVSDLKAMGIKRSDKIAADSSEPDTIKSMVQAGFNVQPAIKGVGSIEYGYRELLNCKIYYTQSSKNIEHEFENHVWEEKTDVDENDVRQLKDVPHDSENHIIDAIRYSYVTYIKRKGGVIVSESRNVDDKHDYEDYIDFGEIFNENNVDFDEILLGADI
jgi:phage terminase large subunit